MRFCRQAGYHIIGKVLGALTYLKGIRFTMLQETKVYFFFFK
jgi:hypothetical protein